MDLAVTLVKSVMRAFYTPREIVVIDALILHETLRDDDLAYLVGVNTKDLHKTCGKLREDRFLTVHTRPEFREGNPRPSNRTWYYINYRNTIDAIKWRVYTIDKEVQGTTVTKTEKKEYFCTFCQAEWTLMEVLDYDSPEGFLCHRCHHVLVREDNRNAGGHEQSTRLNDQFKFITELLPQIDAVHIPECDFDKALAKARPVVRDETHQRAETIAADVGANRPMAVKGLTNTGPQSIAVNISTSDGPSEAEKEAERARKEQIAKQNALPSWMSNSTVTGASFSSAAAAGGLASVKEQANGKASSQVKNEDNNSSSQIDDFFERLKAERAAAEKAQAESEESGSEEDEGEFEDVPATGVSSGRDTTTTPIIKREASRDSAGDMNSSDERQAKRVKIEPGVKIEVNNGGMKNASDDDDDDELEFEDV